MKKSLLILVLAALAATSVPALAGPCYRTGIQVDNSSLTDTVFFYDHARRFNADYVWMRLDPDALGTVTIRRGVDSSGTIRLIDDAVTYYPGEPMKSGDTYLYCVIFTKTVAADILKYSASTCEITETNSTDYLLEQLLISPDARSWAQYPVWSVFYMTADSTDKVWPVAGSGIPTEGATYIELQISWPTGVLSGDFHPTIYRYSGLSAADTSMTFPADSVLFNDDWLRSATEKKVNFIFYPKAGCYLGGYSFFRIKGGGDAAAYCTQTIGSARVGY